MTMGSYFLESILLMNYVIVDVGSIGYSSYLLFLKILSNRIITIF